MISHVRKFFLPNKHVQNHAKMAFPLDMTRQIESTMLSTGQNMLTSFDYYPRSLFPIYFGHVMQLNRISQLKNNICTFDSLKIFFHSFFLLCENNQAFESIVGFDGIENVPKCEIKIRHYLFILEHNEFACQSN